MTPIRSLATIALAALTTAPAFAEWKDDYQIVKFGVLSGENEKDRVQRYDGLKAYLEETLGVTVELFTAGNYDGVVQALAADQIEFAFLGSSSYAAAWKETNGGVVPLLAQQDAEGSSGYYSIIVTRCADGYDSVEQLKDKVLAFADPDSTSGYAVPFYNLVQQGYGDGFFSATPFSGSHEAGVQGVANGTFDAAATYENSKTRGIPQRMVLKGMLEDGVICSIWESPEITNSPFTARTNLPEALITDMRDALEAFPTAEKEAWDAMVSNEIGGENPVVDYIRVDHDRYQWIIDMRDWLREQRRG